MYQVLYRKYRPKKFADVYGQPHITSTLLGELRTGKIAHAYLFTGTRGTGKTTCAKIFAKAVNCLNPQNGDPCGECEMCSRLDDGSLLDVVEIDAASNNGVDYIRDLREAANFTPAAAKYRVYIIDEVHMLSDSAFNALLKTLEEPPEYMIFILATTEVHKVPATILSRCQRFDFHRIPMQELIAGLRSVTKKENIDIDDEALRIIARFADGAMRDALSLLDRCSSTGEKITAERAIGAMGTTGRDHLFEISKAVNAHDTAQLLDTVNRLYADSKDMTRLCTELIAHYRDMMLAKMLKKTGDVINGTPDEITALMNAAHSMQTEEIIRATELLQTAQQNIRAGSTPRTELEMTLLKLADMRLDDSVSSLSARIAALEKRLDMIAAGTLRSAPSDMQPEQPASPSLHPQQDDDDMVTMAENAADSYRYGVIDTPEGVEEAETNESESLADDSPSKSNGGAVPSDTADISPDMTNGDVEIIQWAEILNALKLKNPLLAASLKTSRAIIRNDLLLIDSDNPMFRDILRSDEAARSALKSSAAAILGRLYRLGPYTPPPHPTENTVISAQPVKEQPKELDPLDSFIDEMRSNGTNINITE